jgi:carboxyl-terminal processing protease
MSRTTSPSGRDRGAWSAAVAVMLLVSTFALSAPAAFGQSTGRSGEEQRYLQIFDSVFQYVLRNYVDEKDPKELYEGAMKGLFESLGDPYSDFLDAETMSFMNDLTEGAFGGVGVSISKQSRDPRKPEDAPRYIEIVSPIEDTPGWRAGLQPRDLILEINGETTVPLSTEEAKNRIRGTPGTKVNLKIRRGASFEFTVELERAIIQLPSVKSALIPRQGRNVAYLRITDFNGNTYGLVQDALKTLGKGGYASMVIDVRSNPGGILESAVQIADLFLDRGTIVSRRGRTKGEDQVSVADQKLGVPQDVRVAILIDRGSASSSEILTAALKDNKRALVIGETSFGKGSVQNIIPIDETGIKLTIARYYAPSGENVDKFGIAPDIEWKEPEFTEAETAELERLLGTAVIADFAEKNPEASPASRNAFAAGLAKDYKLSEEILRRLVRNELMRKSIAPVYDLEFDHSLALALDSLERADYPSLLAGAKSVKDDIGPRRAAAKAEEAALAAAAP